MIVQEICASHERFAYEGEERSNSNSSNSNNSSSKKSLQIMPRTLNCGSRGLHFSFRRHGNNSKETGESL